jgi:hypothetical protein
VILPLGIWLLSVIFAAFFGHGLMLQINERRVRRRWYVWEPHEKREYIMKADNPAEYWTSIGIQAMLFAVCAGVARAQL